LESCESADIHVLADFGDLLRQQILDDDGWILDEGLFEQAIFLVELLELALDDFRPGGRWLAEFLGLPFVDAALFRDDIFGNLFPSDVGRAGDNRSLCRCCSRSQSGPSGNPECRPLFFHVTL